jgi:hypothetical protein
MFFSRFAQSAAALALLTIGLAAPAHAQNNKQIISGTWYEDRAQLSSFTNSGTFLLNFTQTPSNQFLNITNVSCSVTTASAQIISDMTLNAGSSSGGNDLGRPYSIVGNINPQTSGTSRYQSIVQNGIFFKFGPGRYPSIEIATQSTGSFFATATCVIVGNLTDSQAA